MDRLFNEVAKQIDWLRLARDFMRGALGSHGYTMPDGDPVVDEVAAANLIDVGQVRITVQQLLTSSVIKDYAMARDFRIAMNQICRAAVERDDLLTETAARVVDWLRGELRSVRTLRSAMIFERINRYNARSMFASLGQWVRRAGSAGLLIVVDVSRFASRRPITGPDGTEMRRPSLVAVMDTYEMMRQCIDGTDEMYGVAICFLTGPEFVQDDKRGMRAYSALEQRLTDDVRDRRRSNPHAPERACTRHCRRKRFNEQHQLATPWPRSSGLPPALAQASACRCRPAFDPGRAHHFYRKLDIPLASSRGPLHDPACDQRGRRDCPPPSAATHER
jgi:hypothetical protein